jgi:NAD(P)-dependent dehydrogenase (short-subunit alcohol dehydrogenase family)
MLSRSTELSAKLAKELPDAKAYECDAGNAASIEKAFAQVRKDLGEVDVLVYNAGSGVWGNVEEVTAEGFETSWRVNAFGAFVAAKQVISAMKKKGAGNIVFIGATASRRGNIRTAAFAPGKAAQRSLAEAMAKQLWPQGIHVSVIIVDGVIDLPRTRERLPDKPDSFFLNPADIASTVYWVTQQPRSAWSFEVESRPFAEVW